MAVFVDDMKAGFGRMKMCHMIADSEDELDAMADQIGVARRWRQGEPGYDSHYDIALSKRALAVAAGAIQITWKQCGMMVGVRKRMGFLPKPEDAERILKELRRASDQLEPSAGYGR